MNTLTPEGVRDIPGYEGIYGVTVDGKVWSYPKFYSRSSKGIWLKQYVKRGYFQVALCKYDDELQQFTQKYKQVHRLVAMTYINADDLSLQVNHMDGNKQNNHVSNLEWCTPLENVRHAIYVTKRHNVSGHNNGNAKLKADEIDSIRSLFGEKTRGQLAAQFKVDPSTISDIVAYRTHKRKGVTV